MSRLKERRRLPACIFGSLRSHLIISALPEALPASICVRIGLPKKGCLVNEQRNRLCSCLLRPHADCLLPDGRPAPQGQALAPGDVASSRPAAGRCPAKPAKKKKSKRRKCSTRRSGRQLRGCTSSRQLLREDAMPRAETPPVNGVLVVLRFCSAMRSTARGAGAVFSHTKKAAVRRRTASLADSGRFMNIGFLMNTDERVHKSTYPRPLKIKKASCTAF